MKQTRRNKALSGLVCMVLTAVTALSVTACSRTQTEAPADSTVLYAAADTPHQVGEGETTFEFTVVDLEGETVNFEVSTDADTVGAALQEVGLIEGEEGPYGLMVNTVNGVCYVYEEGAYWGFFIDGEYAMNGVDATPIEADKLYSLEATEA